MVNTYVVPPLVFAAMGGIGFMLRAVLLELWTRIRKRYITTLRMDSKDENYKVVVDYIGEQASFMSSSMLVETHKKKQDVEGLARGVHDGQAKESLDGLSPRQ